MERWRKAVEDAWPSWRKRALDRWSELRARGFGCSWERSPPAAALAAYASLALLVADPKTAARLFPRHDLTNSLVLTSFAGTSAWLWRRPHVAGTPPSRRFPWVFLGSSLYVLGSTLMWAIVRSAVGRRSMLSVTLCFATGAALTYSAIDYFEYLDRDFEPLPEVSEELNHELSDEDIDDL